MKQLAIGIALAAALAPAASATSFVRVADEALADQASLIVVGTVVSRGAPQGLMATDYHLRVDEVVAGSVATPEVVVRVPGGGDGAVRRKIWGAPAFQRGERALLFLSAGDGGTWRV